MNSVEYLQKIKPKEPSEDIADFSLAYALRESTRVAYYSAPKASWTELEFAVGGASYARFVGRDEPRANIVFQHKDDELAIMICEGKGSLKDITSSGQGGF